MIEWYFPWGRVDWVLRAELIVWLVAVLAGCRIAWRTLVRGRPWLRRDDEDAP